MTGATAFVLIYSYAIPLLILALAVSCVRNRFKPHLRDIPGPSLAAYTKFWRLYDVSKGQAHWTTIELHRKHGDLVRLAPNVVSVGDPAMVPLIYNSKGDFTKTAFYPIQSVCYASSAFHGMRGLIKLNGQITWQKKAQYNIFSTRSETEHREQKRKVANVFTSDSLLKMEDSIDDCGNLFVSRMHDFARDGKAFDLGTWLQFYAFDVVGELTFNQKLGFLEKGQDVDGMMEAIEGLLAYAANIGQIPEAHTFLLGNPLLPILLPSIENWNEIVNFTLKAVNARTNLTKNGELELKGDQGGQDMLSKWAAAKSADPLKMSTRDCVVHLSTNVVAGSDTTAIALRAILYFLIKTPGKMEKAQKEIDDATAAGKLSNPVKEKETRLHLPYMNAVMQEAMRMHPSVGLIMERHVPASGAVICDKYLPGRTIVGINSWVLHYDPKVFPNPHKFEPERWLPTRDNAEHLAVMEKSYLPFGAGKRGCIGKHISLIEMRKIIPQLLREFDISIEGDKEWKVHNNWFVQQKMPPCILKPRKAK